MDQAQLQKLIAEFYEKLPPTAQEFFGDMAWMETLKNISVMHNLNPIQIEVLGTETTLVLLGIIHLDEYEEIVTKELSLPKELTEKILREIDEKILKTLRPTLQVAYTQNVEDINFLGRGDEQEKVDPRLALLPQNVQQAIANSGYQKKLYEIGSVHKLQISQMAALEDVTVKFLSGAISPTRYESDVALATELPAATIKDIAKEINDTILVSIRQNMQQQESAAASGGLDSDDEVPIPPYAPTPIQPKIAEPVKIADITEDIVPKPPVITEINTPAPVKQPTISMPQSFVGDKLFGATKIQAVTSDHSTPKIDTTKDTVVKPPETATISKGFDPYHEAIE